MSSEREESPEPDWLSCFQPPKTSFVELTSSSDSSPSNSPKREEESDREEPAGHVTAKPKKQDQNKDPVFIDSGGESPVNKPQKSKSRKVKKKLKDQTLTEGDENNGEAGTEEILDKPTEPNVSATLPLVFPEKVQRTKVLVECDGESIDMSGDVGAVGRVVISNTSAGNHEMLLDLKGTIYKTTIVPSRTFCIVSFGQAEAKIEAIMNDFVQLKPHSNVYESETMIEGTLDGFSFDSEDEGDKSHRASTGLGDQNNGNNEQIDPKSKRKLDKSEEQTKLKHKRKVENSLGVQKKGKTKGKPPAKGARKSQAPKKAKTSKK